MEEKEEREVRKISGRKQVGAWMSNICGMTVSQLPEKNNNSTVIILIYQSIKKTQTEKNCLLSVYNRKLNPDVGVNQNLQFPC